MTWRRTLILIISAPLLAGAVLVLLVLYRASPYRTTGYAQGYDPGAFAQVQVGTPRDRVEVLLGQPLSVSIGGDRQTLHYTGPVASPDHMVRRRVFVDARSRLVVGIDDDVSWNYLSHWWSGGAMF